MSSGEVQMSHDSVGNWTVRLPDGSILATPNTTSQGVMEAVLWGWRDNGYTVRLKGGGYTGPSAGRKGFSRITHSTSLIFPPGRGNKFFAEAVEFKYTGPPDQDAIVFDTLDNCRIDTENSCHLYPATAAAVRFKPMNDNGEGIVGVYDSTINLGSIIPCTASEQPDPTRGTCVRITLGTNVPFVLCDLKLMEGNGGQEGWVLDDSGTGAQFSGNDLKAYLHGQGRKCFRIGQSTAANAKSFGNEFRLKLIPVTGADALETWGGAPYGGDEYHAQILNGNRGILCQPGSACNVFAGAMNATTVPWTNLGAATNRRV